MSKVDCGVLKLKNKMKNNLKTKKVLVVPRKLIVSPKIECHRAQSCKGVILITAEKTQNGESCDFDEHHRLNS